MVENDACGADELASVVALDTPFGDKLPATIENRYTVESFVRYIDVPIGTDGDRHRPPQLAVALATSAKNPQVLLVNGAHGYPLAHFSFEFRAAPVQDVQHLVGAYRHVDRVVESLGPAHPEEA